MGIARTRASRTNHFVYVCYSTTIDNRVARLTLDYPVSTALSGWSLVLSGIPHGSSSHNGCRLDFQPGASPPVLFVTTGDAEVGTVPQDAAGLGGKVLRIQTDGTAYPGNASGQRWYTRGHRNPQGITFRPGSNGPHSIEHGPGVDDEVNKLVNGGNAGWNPIPNYNQSVPMTDPNVPGGNVFSAVWKSGNVTVAPSGGTFVTGAQWKSWDGALLVRVPRRRCQCRPAPPRRHPRRGGDHCDFRLLHPRQREPSPNCGSGS